MAKLVWAQCQRNLAVRRRKGLHFLSQRLAKLTRPSADWRPRRRDSTATTPSISATPSLAHNSTAPPTATSQPQTTIPATKMVTDETVEVVTETEPKAVTMAPANATDEVDGKQDVMATRHGPTVSCLAAIRTRLAGDKKRVSSEQP